MTTDRTTNDEHDFEDPSTAWVSDAVRDLGLVEPPQTFVATVMSSIESNRASKSQQAQTPVGRGEKMGKKVLWGVMAAAAALIVTFMIEGFPPGDNGSVGTIGAAKRYQADQIAREDVKTDDAALQTFLQSDAFNTLTTDKASRMVLANKDFRSAVADPAVRAALASPAVVRALAIPAVAQALANPNVMQALATPAVAQAMNSAAFQQALAQQGVQAALASQAFFMKAEIGRAHV